MLALLTADRPSSPSGTHHPRDVRSVELRDVHYAYERTGRTEKALRGISFSWRASEILALAGPNGSGKSTCLRVLLGLAEPLDGDVLIDGVPLRNLDLDHWRRSITFLPQRPYLPPRATVRDCLRFVDPEVTDEIMARAVDRVWLMGALEHEPGSVLDMRVDGLSVGQRQRVALARVLCRPAPIVMLDEPDANLDHAGAELMAGLLRELAQNRMVIVVAHSPTVLAAADRVLNIDLGRVVGEGSARR